MSKQWWIAVPEGWQVESLTSVPVYDEKTDPPTFLGYRRDAHLTRFDAYDDKPVGPPAEPVPADPTPPTEPEPDAVVRTAG